MQSIFEKELLKQSVFLDRDIISPHYIPKELPFRENQINEISSVLAPCISGKKPSNLFVYGVVGAGKTVTTKHVLLELSNFGLQKNIFIKTSFVNCRNNNSKYKSLIKIVNELYPENNFMGFSASFIYDKILAYCKEHECKLIIVLDEIDLVKDINELVYCLTRANDDLSKSSITLIGISNNLLFKEKLDTRTKSSLLEKELVFQPYNAQELKEILIKRAQIGLQANAVDINAINLASAIAAKESGDARTALMLLLRAGEIADANGLSLISDREVELARKNVELDIALNMISSLPEQQKLVLLAIADLSEKSLGLKKISGEIEAGVLFSGDIYENYSAIAKSFNENPVSARWYREYINELETYGLITTTHSGHGIRGSTTLIKLAIPAYQVKQSVRQNELV